MGNVLIRDFPPALKEEISKTANSNGRSISEEIKLRLQRESRAAASSASKSGGQFLAELRSAFEGVFETDEEFEKFHQEMDDLRKKDFVRPPPDLG
jgi:hypothetical protein